MSGRGGVRSSARLSGDASVGSAGAAAPFPGPTVRVALGRGRPLSSTTAAAQRRARAAERAREVEDSPRVLRDKCRRLARALRNAKHLVVYTGAGISTAADIPDYRGPDGVWTRLQRGETVGRVEVSRAQPTFTHMALTALWARGALKFVVSQNCDGLHLRSGLPRRALAELHGDMFAELCASCRRVYLRAFDTTERTARHQHGTRRLCHACGAELRDSIVHFGERGRAAWPLNWAGALRHAARADVVLCLGSSLKVLRRYPRLWRMESAPRARPALFIVNLQWTPKDSVAALKINARCDAVMRQVARRLRLRVPRYRASRDPVLAHAEPLAAPEAHTTRRPLLAFGPDDSASDEWEPSSPSASDSDEELPLRRLADRLRAPSAAQDQRVPQLHAVPPSASDALCAFQVSLQSCEATILLRAEHAPPAPPPSRTSDLRKFRMVRCGPESRPLVLNGHVAGPDDRRLSRPPAGATLAEPKQGLVNGSLGLDSRLRRLLQYEPRIEAGDDTKGAQEYRRPEVSATTRFEVKTEESDAKADPSSAGANSPAQSTAVPKLEVKTEAKLEAKDEASSSESEAGALAAGSLAAAIIRRAVLLCRASLYPGLHTIIAPAAAPAPAPECVECAWCARHFAARRCLWYGAPREPPPSSRAWRRVRGRRYLCACCGVPGQSPPRPPAPDEGGWYGKGYRKGRRRRR